MVRRILVIHRGNMTDIINFIESKIDLLKRSNQELVFKIRNFKKGCYLYVSR